MKAFLDDNFLLDTVTAQTLYHDYAASMPIVDYHCHIDPKDIYEDVRFANITQLWLGGDHYKWRLMRAYGLSEDYITGERDDHDKFIKFAELLPRAIGNPLYHWCHLELRRYFGYQGVLGPDTAEEVWQLCNEKLQNDPNMSARGLIAKSNVAMIGTTDDPVSNLEWHRKLAADPTFGTQVCPSFRPDPAINILKPGFSAYIQALATAADMTIETVDDVCKALSLRIGYFVNLGCKAADHGMDYLAFRLADKSELDKTLQKALAGEEIGLEEAHAYQTALLLHCAAEYAKHSIVLQIHFSCMRNPNSAMFKTLGPDTGFDAMAVTDSCKSAYRIMDYLYQHHSLPKTVLYSLNPADNAWLDTLIGSFQVPGSRQHVQHGSAWWFNDHKIGMTEQLASLANSSLLGNFIGMLTDSRSFLSYTRHEYFRRVLCAFIGRLVANGEYPDDMATLGAIVQAICYYNAKEFFNLD